MTPDEIISQLALEPHPEGGWYRQTWRADADAGQPSAGTAIFYLLEAHQRSHWHRLSSTEVWHWYAGAPLELSTAENGDCEPGVRTLGSDLGKGELPQLIVPPRHWQAARSTGAFSLVGCTVSPGFEFSTFELAPSGWAPSARR